MQLCHRAAERVALFLAPLLVTLAVVLAIPAVAAAATGTVSWTGSCLNVRTGPGTGYGAITCLPDGTTINIDCQTTGDVVTGPYGSTTIWDHASDYGGYVTDAYIETGSNGWIAPQCDTGGYVRGDDYPYANDPYGCSDPICIDPWLFYKRECTSFVAHRMNNSLGVYFSNNMNGGHFGDAYNWDDNAASLGWRVDHTPKVNAIAQWNAGEGGASSGGHVAFVATVNSDHTVTLEEYNWAGLHSYHTRTISITDVGRYIHVPGT
jgi:surface antigen